MFNTLSMLLLTGAIAVGTVQTGVAWYAWLTVPVALTALASGSGVVKIYYEMRIMEEEGRPQLYVCRGCHLRCELKVHPRKGEEGQEHSDMTQCPCGGNAEWRQ